MYNIQCHNAEYKPNRNYQPFHNPLFYNHTTHMTRVLELLGKKQCCVCMCVYMHLITYMLTTSILHCTCPLTLVKVIHLSLCIPSYSSEQYIQSTSIIYLKPWSYTIIIVKWHCMHLCNVTYTNNLITFLLLSDYFQDVCVQCVHMQEKIKCIAGGHG